MAEANPNVVSEADIRTVRRAAEDTAVPRVESGTIASIGRPDRSYEEHQRTYPE